MEFTIDLIKNVVDNALREDIGSGDITSECTIRKDAKLKGKLISKADGIIAGLEVVNYIFRKLNPEIQVNACFADGDRVSQGDLIAEITGDGRSILTGERTALNFLQRMSGIATMTRAFVDRISDTNAIILDTRKTAPGLRITDKWAVRIGGGQNHRIGLFDMVLIKDNHIDACGGITAAVERVRYGDRENRLIEVEVKTINELREAVTLKVDRIMLDNMDLQTMKEAVGIVNGKIPLEASGNVALDNVSAIAATGVNYISVGKLTHSAPALDISLLLS